MDSTPGKASPQCPAGGVAFLRIMCLVITPFVAVVTILAVARVSRLVTSDIILSTPRTALINRLGPTSRGAYLATCDWCMSMWIAAPAAVAAWNWGGTWGFQIPALALAASYVAGYLSQVGGE